MDTLTDIKNWLHGLVKTEAKSPLWVHISPERVEGGRTGDRRLAVGRDYFRLRVDRIQLAYERELWETYAPLLLVATDFSYGGQEVSCPAAIGPSMIEQPGRPVPLCTTIAGTVVAGPHPLSPGGLGVTVALYRVAMGNVASGFLNVVESVTKTLDLAAGLTPYAAIASAVMKGITAVTGGDQALMARRDQFTTVVPGSFALIAPTATVDPDRLRVANGELMESIDGRLRPFRGADYVLYSLDRAEPEDVDITRLPLHRQWLTVLDEANMASTAEIWESAKVNLSALIRMAFQSPDLTYEHAEKLEQEWVAKAMQRRDRARQRGSMGGEPAQQDDVRDRSLAVLAL